MLNNKVKHTYIFKENRQGIIILNYTKSTEHIKTTDFKFITTLLILYYAVIFKGRLAILLCKYCKQQCLRKRQWLRRNTFPLRFIEGENCDRYIYNPATALFNVLRYRVSRKKEKVLW